MVTGGRDKPARRTDPGVKETVPGGVLPAGAPGDAGRVPAVPPGAPPGRLAVRGALAGSRRGGARQYPGSSARQHGTGRRCLGLAASHPSLAVVRGRGGVRGRVFRPGGRRSGGDGPRPVAGRAQRGRRRVHRRRGGHRRVGCVAGRERRDRTCRAARQQSLDIRGGHRIRRVRGGHRPDPAFALVALVAGRGCGVAAQRAGRGRADAFRRGDRALRRAAGWMAGALASRRGVGPAGPGRTRGLA